MPDHRFSGNATENIAQLMLAIANCAINNKLTEREEQELLKVARDESLPAAVRTSARDKLVLSVAMMVPKVARRVKSRKLTFDDLVSEGLVGVMEAVDKFDPQLAKGARFSSYAYYWVYAKMSKAVHKLDRTVRLPTHLIEKIATYNRLKNELLAESPEMSQSEVFLTVTKRMGMTFRKMVTFFDAMMSMRWDEPPEAADDETWKESDDEANGYGEWD